MCWRRRTKVTWNGWRRFCASTDSYRLGSRAAHAGETILEEASFMAGDLRVR